MRSLHLRLESIDAAEVYQIFGLLIDGIERIISFEGEQHG
ncbi:hypothetical protein CCP3SC15_2170005 [Gammaproteobacteria bacterium]